MIDTKPFGMRELIARVRALLRRVERVEAMVEADRARAEAQLVFGALNLSPGIPGRASNGHELDLTRTEFQLLHLLVRATLDVPSAATICSMLSGVRRMSWGIGLSTMQSFACAGNSAALPMIGDGLGCGIPAEYTPCWQAPGGRCPDGGGQGRVHTAWTAWPELRHGGRGETVLLLPWCDDRQGIGRDMVAWSLCALRPGADLGSHCTQAPLGTVALVVLLAALWNAVRFTSS